MENHFNNLTPAEAERLAILMEECAEVQQAIGKILRHGFESTYPGGDETNRKALARELGDLTAVIQLCYNDEDIDAEEVTRAYVLKLINIKKYLHHN